MSGFLVKCNVGRIEINFPLWFTKKQYKAKKDYAEKFSETTSIETKSPHWTGNRKLSMEDIDAELFFQFQLVLVTT